MFSLESPHRGDSNEYTHHNIFDVKRKSPEISQIQSFLQLWYVLLGTQERVRNNRGKRAIGVRANEVLLYHEHVLTTHLSTGLTASL